MNDKLADEFVKTMEAETDATIIYRKCPFCSSQELGCFIPTKTWFCDDCKKVWDKTGKEKVNYII